MNLSIDLFFCFDLNEIDEMKSVWKKCYFVNEKTAFDFSEARTGSDWLLEVSGQPEFFHPAGGLGVLVDASGM